MPPSPASDWTQSGPARARRRTAGPLGAPGLAVLVLGAAWLSGGCSNRGEKPREGAPAPPPEAGADQKAPRPRQGEPFTNSAGMKFVWVEPGTFRMGSPPDEPSANSNEAAHRVTLTKGFHLGARLVTQRQWEQVMGEGENRSRFPGKDGDEKGRLPVDSVSWSDCQDFCRKLGAREGRRYRLPTEAEWEYACRAGTTTPFWWGEEITTDQANYDGNHTYGKDGQDAKSGKPGEYRHRPTPVDFFRPNPWGLYDMHGNLRQWCQDAYGPYPGGEQTDPLQEGKGQDRRVLRGGSWEDYPWWCRAAWREGAEPGLRGRHVGCRVVLCLD